MSILKQQPHESDLDDIVAAIRRAGIQMGLAMRPAMERVGLAVTMFADAISKMATQLYLKEHKRLPGSFRTKRLRLKRHKKS